MRTISFLLLSIFMVVSPAQGSGSHEGGPFPRIARWYEGRSGAVSLRFDDNLASHLERAVPALDRYGIRATFMVSPGRSSFLEYREEWLEQVPSAGHELGNHTMHHRGARNLPEARYEIGEAARLIRQAGGDPDRLLVFASGGGKSWGGRRWSEAEEAYRRIPGSLGMIDLYDGTHPYVNVVGTSAPGELIGYVDRAAEEGKHQAFTFHGVGRPTLRDLLRRLVNGKDLTISEEDFHAFLEMLRRRSDKVWIAPLGAVLKYEAQFRSARLEILDGGHSSLSFRLVAGTDPVLYDHPLTVILPWSEETPVRVLQNGRPVEKTYGVDGRMAVDLSPETSLVRVDPAAGTAPAD